MDEVYRARDTKLGCDVEIKVFPQDFADDPERHELFEREAEMMAALNHPNISAPYDFGLARPVENPQSLSTSDAIN